MLSRIEKYQITTLCKPDSLEIEKTKDYFKKTVRRILEEKPEFIGHIMTGYMGSGKPRTIEFYNRSIPVCRLGWKIVGEKDILDQFFDEWKRIDGNPCRSFRVERFCSWSEFTRSINIDEKGDMKAND